MGANWVVGFACAATTAEASRLAAARHTRRHPHHRRRPARPNPKNHSTRTRRSPDGRHLPGSASVADGDVRPIPRTLTESATTWPALLPKQVAAPDARTTHGSPHSPEHKESQSRLIRTNVRYHVEARLLVQRPSRKSFRGLTFARWYLASGAIAPRVRRIL